MNAHYCAKLRYHCTAIPDPLSDPLHPLYYLLLYYYALLSHTHFKKNNTNNAGNNKKIYTCSNYAPGP